MSLRRWARPMVRLGRTRAVAPRRLRQFSSFQRDIDGQRRGPTRYWLRVALLGLVVGSSGALLGSEDRQRAARAVVSLGRILADIAYDQRDHSSEDAKEAASAEDRIASILATMAQEQTFRQALVAHGGVQVLLKALPHANDVILRNRILTAIASVATTPGTDAALADHETTSHLLLHLPAADLPLLDRLKIDMALKHVHDVPRRPAISLPIDVAPTVHRLASATMLSRATSDERKFALQSLTSLLLTAESQSASAALDTALRTLLSNTPLVANLRELAVTPASPLQEPAATLLVALFRLSGLCGISLQEPASWHAQFVSWAYVDAPAVHVAAAEAWHLIAKQSPDVLLSSKAGQDALLQLARATFPPTSRTPSVQMHICAIVSALGDRFTDGLGTTMATPMSRVFRDADVLDAAELDATPVLGWVDVLTQWSFHGTSAVRHHAIQSLSHLALRQDASRRVLQAWMLGLLRELFAAPDMVAEERRAVHEVEVLANMTSETTPGHVNVSFSDDVLEAGMAAMAILAEKHAPDFIWKGGVDLLSLVAVTSPPAIKAQCARILANLATYPWQPHDLERDVQRILVQEATGGSLFFDEICHWRDEPNVNIRSSYYRAATNLAVLQASSAAEENSPPPVYREGIHPIVAQSSASSTTMPPVDVVFVHGLRGHPFGTWRSDMASTDMVNSPIWPEALLAPDLSPDSRLVTLGYEAGMVTWSSPWPSLTLPQRAQIMLEALEAARIGRANGPPVIFVTHSMGGLLVKEMLVLAKAQERSLASRTAGVVFMAVPHFGANVSSNVNARAIRALIQAHPATKDLSANAPHLLALHKAYQALQIPSLSLGEGQPAPLALGVRSMVVLPDSANPGGPLDEFHLLSNTDHMDICKPQTVDDPRYTLVIDFLRACVA